MTATPPKTAYEQLVDACLPLIEAYRDDLLKHDKLWFEQNPGVPFLHWTRPCGTTICGLPAADSYPKGGERVKYLFGTADRWHLLKEVVEMAEHHTRPSNSPEQFTCHHFDGKKLRKITIETAVDVARQYVRRIEAEWNKRNRQVGVSDWS